MKNWIVLLPLVLLIGCVPSPPRDTDNICAVFQEYPRWYWDAKKSQKKWGVSVPVQMAIIHQESRFNGKAKPERTRFLWVIPWKRPSTSYGYSQALQITWDDYEAHTGKKHKRDKFSSATDFIGWYANQAHTRAGIKKNDAYSLYLAYHEGIGGYERKTYKDKKWLVNVAKRVNARAAVYDEQLKSCRKKIKKSWWYAL